MRWEWFLLPNVMFMKAICIHFIFYLFCLPFFPFISLFFSLSFRFGLCRESVGGRGSKVRLWSLMGPLMSFGNFGVIIVLGSPNDWD